MHVFDGVLLNFLNSFSGRFFLQLLQRSMFGYIQQNEMTPLFIAIRSYTRCEWPDCRRHRNSSCSVYVWCNREDNCNYDTILCIFRQNFNYDTWCNSEGDCVRYKLIIKILCIFGRINYDNRYIVHREGDTELVIKILCIVKAIVCDTKLVIVKNR